MAATRPLSLLLRLMEPTPQVADRLRDVVAASTRDRELSLDEWRALGVIALVIGERDVALSPEDWRAAWARVAKLIQERGAEDVLLRVCGDEYAVGTFADIGETAMSNRDAQGNYASIHEVTAAPLVETLDQQAERAG